MSKLIQAPAILRVLEIGIASIQLFDIILHALTNQLEILRVSSNGIILLWLAIVVTGKFKAKFLQTAAGAIGGYFVLNLIFLGFEGVTNVEQGGEVRVPLFVLMFLTLTFSSLLTYLLGRHPGAR